MITDHWVIVQLIGQFSVLIIFIIAFIYAVKILRRWNINNFSQEQLSLERNTYLVSVILHYVLIFQFVLFILFIEIVNSHLPALIKGAMCARGALGINDLGFPLLYIKIISIVFYSIFLFLNFLDQNEPYYPLTPAKYKLMPLILLFITLDFLMSYRFFSLIKPDVIATCCSISFPLSPSNTGTLSMQNSMLSHILLIYYIISVLLLIMLYLHKHGIWLIGTAAVYIITAVTALKEHFIRYIYARPTHNCLFDIFWADYYGIGYLLYGLLFIPLLAVIFIVIIGIARNKLKKRYTGLIIKLRRTAVISVLIYALIIHLYWLKWIIMY